MPDVRPSPLAAIGKVVNRARRRGPLEVTRLGVQRAAEWFSSGDTLVMFVRDAGGDPPTKSSFEFRAANSNDAESYARWIATDSERTFLGRLSESTRCFVVTDDGRLVHASWVTTAAAWTRELRRYLIPPGGDAYVYESFTRAEVRGRGIYPFALQSIAAWMGREGAARLWVAVEEDNAPSLRAVTKGGFERGFELPYRRRLGKVTVASATGPRAEIASLFLSVKSHRSAL